MEKYGFIYIWRDRKHKRYYIGCRWGRKDDGYICSSAWMRNAYSRRPHDFKRRILAFVYTNRTELLNSEFKYLSFIKEEELGTRYYNLNNKRQGHWTENKEKLLTIGQKISASHSSNPNWGAWAKGKIVTGETRIKMSLAHLGKPSSFKGKNHSEETRAKISQIKQGQGHPHTEESKQKISLANTGKKHSEETIQKLRLSCLGRPSPMKGKKHSEETRVKISQTLLAKRSE